MTVPGAKRGSFNLTRNGKPGVEVAPVFHGATSTFMQPYL